ncbi:MAG: SDR family oxidoreductase [Alphaproteobacteria bacterium]
MSGVLVVTGGGRGIGAAIAVLGGARGYKVCVNYSRAMDRAAAVVESIRDQGGRAIAVRADVAEESAVVRMFREVDDKLGPVSALVNNAGIDIPPTDFADLDPAKLERLFAVNVFGVFLCAREAIKRMSTARGGTGGVIVNISSRASVHGRLVREVPYAASKGAIDAMTITLANEVAQQGIRVATIRPGLIVTEIFDSIGGEAALNEIAKAGVPMGRPGQAREIANAALWLCSEEASYVTGAILDVGGGR